MQTAFVNTTSDAATVSYISSNKFSTVSAAFTVSQRTVNQRQMNNSMSNKTVMKVTNLPDNGADKMKS